MTESLEEERVNSQLEYIAGFDTSILPPDGGPDFNRLIFSRSPYLLQHATNPVDWYPWGEEAFDRAKRENKPVFLSIGYATCHWCHVMERESFTDNEVASVLNDRFVSIKVDREERPDIDDQYMSVAQMMTGGGGWPLTIFMTPDRRPFFAATYLPKTPKMNLPGIIEVLEKVDEHWRNNRSLLEENCAAIIEKLNEDAVPSAGLLKDKEIFTQAYLLLERGFDTTWGGYGGAPKFPLPHYLSFLLRYFKKTGNAFALTMVEHTIDSIRRGGIFDQIGFGLHRYSVDKMWLVPHFEKMLYDQAMMSLACLEAFQVTGDLRYSKMAGELFDYVLREMISPHGGFYSAWDADTNGVEGAYYTWTFGEVADVIGAESAGLFCRLFGITDGGNFEGRNILHLTQTLDEFAAREKMDPQELASNLQEWRLKLRSAREARKKPFRDEKVLTSWNGLMIATLARGYAVTGEKRYARAAADAAGFIRQNMLNGEGRLLRSWYRGGASVQGFLEDYAFYTWGLLELYEATLEVEYLEEAKRVAVMMLKLFRDEENYGFFDTAADVTDVLVRKKSRHDGVTPSGNAIASLCLIKLGRILHDDPMLEEGRGIVRAFMGSVAENPIAALQYLITLDCLNAPEVEVTFAGERDCPETGEMLREVRRRFIPGLVLRFAAEEGAGRTEARICANGSCRLPVACVRDLKALLDEIV
ncbi:MAG: thioredoxin domain-containing protein [Geobacteraceae bacterium]|nr:thioredoxin domain-containing protein [Geobacteraceae bacterium]